jgi:hypothetical protein
MGIGWLALILGRLIFEYIVVDRFDRGTAGDIAADMTAHAIGDQDKAQVTVDLKRILVLRTDAPHIGAAGELN